MIFNKYGKQIETDQKFEQIFTALQNNELEPKQGIFFDGQVFDAYKFKDVFYIGASLKDLGKKWFAFSKFDKIAFSLLENINTVSADE